LTASGEPLGAMLDWWEQSERRIALRRVLRDRDGIDPDDVIMDPDRARSRGLTSTVTFPIGNLAPGGCVIKSTAIDPSVVGEDGVYRKTGPARVFRTEHDVIAAIKANRRDPADANAIREVIAPWGETIGDSRFETEGEWRQKLAGGTSSTVDQLARELRAALRR